MRQRKLKRFWICRHGHPMYRKKSNGYWICYTCNDLNLNHSKDEKTFCSRGHKRVKGGKCLVCRAYQNAPWLRDLDATGEGLCGQGHPVSHYDDSILYVRGKRNSRRCRRCQVESFEKAVSLAPKRSEGGMCANGLHPRTPENMKHNSRGEGQCKPCHKAATRASVERVALRRQRESSLRPSSIDWVVVERLLAKGQMDYLKRGRHRGPTDGERWVAYCTFVAQHGKHPEEMYGETGHDAMKLWKLSAWRDLGKKHRWKNLTLYEVLTLIHTDRYVTGGLLTRNKPRPKREDPR